MDGHVIENPGPWDHPLRPWEETDDCRAVLAVTLEAAGAKSAALSALAGAQLDDRDLAAIGIANSHAYLSTMHPIAIMTERSRVKLDPVVERLLQERRT